MKAITLNQPWATLIAEGYKKYEFRSWKTNYRGELLIHAGKKIDQNAMKRFEKLNLIYPTSAIVAKVEIEDCIKLNSQINNEIINQNKLIYGLDERSGYAWKLKNVKKVVDCNNIKGKQGLWNYE